jgi:hypothetical protein
MRSVRPRTGRSVAELIRDAIRKGRAEAVSDRSAIWDGKPRRMSHEHDSAAP